jgi:hypothetical protein
MGRVSAERTRQGGSVHEAGVLGEAEGILLIRSIGGLRLKLWHATW